MRSTPEVPITLLIGRGSPPNSATAAPPALDRARRLSERGERVELISQSADEEEFVELDPSGVLVHHVCPARSYTRKLARPVGWSNRVAFAVRAWEKAHELERLWNRSIRRVEATSDPAQTLLFGAWRAAGCQPPSPARRWAPCRSVSLVCPTYNRTAELVCSIESFLIAAAEAERANVECEILIVFQNEGTPQKVLAIHPEWKTAPLHWVRSEPGLPRARNVGVLHGRRDLLIFVDDDVVLDPGFVCAHLNAANATPTSVGNAGRVRSRILGERKALNRAIGQLRLSAFVDTHFDSLTSTPVVPHTPLGANMAFKREAMASLFGDAWFDERLQGSAHREETTLCVELFRRGAHLMFARDASLLHLEAEVGGCENRGTVPIDKEIQHLALDYLFFRRFFKDLGPLASLAPASFLVRDVRQSKQQRLRRLYLNLLAYNEGLRRYHQFQG